MVAEVVPENRRVEAGALLYTSAPLGLFLATFVTYQIQGVYFRTTPETAWRYVFLCGLIPAAVAFMVRLFIREPERWTRIAKTAKHATIGDLFAPAYLRATLTGLSLAIVALVTWWSCNAFIPTIASGLAAREASLLGAADATTLIEQWTGGILRDIMILIRDACRRAILESRPALELPILEAAWKEIQTKQVTDFLELIRSARPS